MHCSIKLISSLCWWSRFHCWVLSEGGRELWYRRRSDWMVVHFSKWKTVRYLGFTINDKQNYEPPQKSKRKRQWTLLFQLFKRSETYHHDWHSKLPRWSSKPVLHPWLYMVANSLVQTHTIIKFDWNIWNIFCSYRDPHRVIHCISFFDLCPLRIRQMRQQLIVKAVNRQSRTLV